VLPDTPLRDDLLITVLKQVDKRADARVMDEHCWQVQLVSERHEFSPSPNGEVALRRPFGTMHFEYRPKIIAYAKPAATAVLEIKLVHQ